MKWIFAVLACALFVVLGLAAVGFKMVSLPLPHDPFPALIRTPIETLDGERREIEWLVGNARMAGKGNALQKERQDYDELANDANAWLKMAAEGLESNKVDAPSLAGQFQGRLMPKAKALIATLTTKTRWMSAQRRDTGILKVAAADADHFIAALENGWTGVSTYFKFSRAGDAESRKIAMTQLDDMKWVPWSELMAEQY